MILIMILILILIMILILILIMILIMILILILNLSVNLSLCCGSSGTGGKRAQKNPGQKLASEKKKSLDKRIGMVYNGNPYCDSMPIYAIPYYMSILTQVAAVVKREVCEF